jgi:hypothetical protein
MRYEPLVDEVVKGTSHWLCHPSTADVKERRAKGGGEGGDGMNLDLANAVLKNSPGIKKKLGMSARSGGSGSARSNIESMSRQKLLSSARKSARESGRSTGRSTGRSARSGGSAGATAVRLLKEQLEEERTKRERVEKELEELRAIKSRASSKGGKGEGKEEDEALRKFRNFKQPGGLIEP